MTTLGTVRVITLSPPKIDRRKQKNSGGGGDEKAKKVKRNFAVIPPPSSPIRPRADKLSGAWPYVVSWTETTFSSEETYFMGTNFAAVAEDVLLWLQEHIKNAFPIGLYVLKGDKYVAVEARDGNKSLFQTFEDEEGKNEDVCDERPPL